MTDRIIEIAETGAFLSLETGLLKIHFPDDRIVTVPIGEIQCLVLANPAVTITGALLSELAECGCITVVSGADRLPSAMFLPLHGNYVQTERFHAQTQASLPLRKRLWQQIVKAKIRQQGNLLKERNGSDYGLSMLAEKTFSGDPENREAQAAAIYWKNLFPVTFRRDRSAHDSNLLLNYGYAVLRAMTARACCAAGLHPTIGINHHNRYDPYCLADDLMEPYRPIIDRKVTSMNPQNNAVEELTQSMRRQLIESLLEKQSTKNGYWGVTDLLRETAEQTARSFMTGEMYLSFFG